VIRRIFEPKRDEVKEGGENCIMRSCMVCTFHQIFRTLILWRMRWAAHEVRMGEIGNSYKILVGEPGRKKELKKSRR
jgi:hypothetical protein